MTGQPLVWDRFWMFTFISWLMVLISQSLGFIIGAWFSVIVSITYMYLFIILIVSLIAILVNRFA